MTRLVAVLLACAGVGVTASLGPAIAARDGGRSSAETYLMAVGDRVRVLGAPIACRVVRVRELDGRVALDCRRAGPLRGTFGTILTPREAAVVHFEGSRVGRLVAVAEHDREIRTCR